MLGPRYAPLLLAGPEGSGRKSMMRKLEKEFPEMCEEPVRHTSRAPIAALGEVDGQHYHFVSKEHMTADIESGKFPGLLVVYDLGWIRQYRLVRIPFLL